jgi:hypothetical protein
VASERLTNLQYVRGAVANCRRRHHVQPRLRRKRLPSDPLAAAEEMKRVCRPGGRVVVMDLASSTDPVIAERQDQMERLRDPSHVRMPARGVVRRWLQAHGLLIDGVAEREIDRPVLPWLEQAVTKASAAALVREALETELAGGAGTGMRPHRGTDGALWFRQLWQITAAHRA